MRKTVLFLFALICATFLNKVANAQILINEYSASNSTIIADYQGDFEDYVELYNTSGTAINLAGYFMSDNATNLNKWVFPAGVSIPANGRLMVYMSNKDLVSPGGQVHASFKLTQCRNEKIIICDAALNILDSLTMQRTQNNHSRGRTTDGAATWSIFTTPSPNAANAGTINAYADKPIFDIPQGFYAAAQSLTLSTPQTGVTIRYTTNGQAPTAASTAYSTPIAIAATTVVRAACFSNTTNLATSFTETNTYFINVTHSSSFNVISLAGNYTGLFGNSQPIRNSMEFFDTLKNFKWEFEGQTKRHGHDSWAFPQKGFRVYPKDEYGYLHTMPEQFFPNSPRNEFDCIILKGGASDNYPSSNGQNATHMRDAYAHTFSIKYDMEFDERNYAPTIIYINGAYWGIYEIRERVDADYTEFYYNQPESKADIVKHWGGGTNILVAGSDTGWTNLRNFCISNNMALANNYNYVESVLNTNSLIDFFVYNNYLANSDHMNWNTMWWRGKKGAGVKWKYALWDQDNIFDLGENYTGLSTTSSALDPCEPFTLFLNSNIVFHTQIINALMNNAVFKKKYQDRYAMWLNTSLTCDTLLKHVDYFEDLLTPEMTKHVARWGGNVNTWHNHFDSVRKFILERCQKVGGNGDTNCVGVQFVTFNVDAVGMGTIKFGPSVLPKYPLKFICPTDSLYSIEAIANPGFKFKEWRIFNNQNQISPTITSASAILNYKRQDSIVAIFEIKPKDSFDIVITANPLWSGSVLVDGSVVLNATNFPYTYKCEEKTSHTLLATPNPDNKFINWNQTNSASNPVGPNLNAASITFVANAADKFVANFDTIILSSKKVFIPNAFSPNGDGKNDVFKIDGANNPGIVSVALTVFDRYGAIVFNGDGLKGWNGKYPDNVNAEIGTYYYAADILFDDKKSKVFKGDIMMIR
jgi:gliding motility-associated-like protein